MTWYHLQDQNGNHYIIPSQLSPVIYFLSQATDGTSPIYMYLNGGLTFQIAPALFTTIVGPVPTAIDVINVNLCGTSTKYSAAYSLLACLAMSRKQYSV